MKTIKLLFICAFFITIYSCKNTSVSTKEVKTVSEKDTKGFSYQKVTNDPTGLRLYTLDNGLKVYLSKNI